MGGSPSANPRQYWLPEVRIFGFLPKLFHLEPETAPRYASSVIRVLSLTGWGSPANPRPYWLPEAHRFGLLQKLFQLEGGRS